MWQRQAGLPHVIRRVETEQRADHHRLDQQHDRSCPGPCSAPRAGRACRDETALEQRSEDRRVDLRPVQVRRRQYRLDVGLLQRQRHAVVEQTAVEPGHRLEADAAAGGHHLEQIAGQLGEPHRSGPRMAQHPREHVVRKQADVVGEHAEEVMKALGVTASTLRPRP